MVWEQEILIIVMLTRLNENGNQMCHCYWPTNVASSASSSLAAGDATGNNKSQQGADNTTSTKGNVNQTTRRGSVTSVFNGAASASKLANGQYGPCPPIVASGDMNDNVLYFNIPAKPTTKLLARSKQNQQPIVDTEEIDELGELDGVAEAIAPDAVIASTSANKIKPRTTSINTKFEVHLISEHVSASDYLVRNMMLINRTTGETRTISQFHYLAWQDSRTPENVRSFLKFRRKVNKSYRNSGSPILVHCSDGGGRSGTYTLIDMILERIRFGVKEIDLRASLEHLRDQRIGLCETQNQFEFALVALAEEIQIILNALPR